MLTLTLTLTLTPTPILITIPIHIPIPIVRVIAPRATLDSIQSYFYLAGSKYIKVQYV